MTEHGGLIAVWRKIPVLRTIKCGCLAFKGKYGPWLPWSERLCFDLQLHMQREARQWTQTTRAILVFLVFLIIAYPVLAATCPLCPPALRHCRVARNRSRGRHVVFVAQCNGRVLHVINIHVGEYHPTAHRRRVQSVQPDPEEQKRERERKVGQGGWGNGRKRRREREGGGRRELSCLCFSPTGAPVKRIEHIGRAR